MPTVGKYVGDWNDGRMVGNGTYFWSNGDKYEGEWKEDMKNGHGILSYADNDQYGRLVYEGGWIDNQMSGNGTMTYKSGERYEGAWKNGLRDGKGTFYSASNKIISTGLWENDKFTG